MTVILLGEPMNGTADDDLIADIPGLEGPNSTINGNDGNDLILGDSDVLFTNFIGQGNVSTATALNINASNGWSTRANPIVNTPGPHTSIYIELGAGEERYFSVTAGAGETITLDIDCTSAWGGSNDLVEVELLNNVGTGVATGNLEQADFGSFYADWRTVHTAATSGTYYIRVREADYGEGTSFEGGEKVFLNVSVTGHAATAAQIAYGNDTINGGDGHDTIFGMLGTDTVHGDAGSDIIVSTGNGHYYGDDGNDTIYAAGGLVETLDGGAGFDILDITSSVLDYTVNLATGATNYSNESFVNFEQLRAGTGNDTLTGTAGDNSIYSGGGNDTVFGLEGNDFIHGGVGADTLYGGVGNDRLYGGGGLDILYGGSDDDDFNTYFANGAAVHGGPGIDSLTLLTNSLVGTLVTVNLDGTSSIGADTMTTSGLENFLFYYSNDVIVTGTAGNNTIRTGLGNDVLNGAAGADTLTGNLGDDRYYVDNAGDVVTEAAGEGSDRVFAHVSYVLGAGQEVEILSTTNNAGTAAINLTGNALANSIAGNNGSNVLNGGAGADTLNGLGGNDMLYVDNAGDVIVEAAGGGSDRVFASVSYALGAAAQVEILSTTNNAGVGAINLTGNGFANSIAGNNGINVLNGGAGADTLSGLGGNDMFFVDSLSDVVIEGAGGGTADRVLTSVNYVLGAGAQVEILSTTNNVGVGAINLAGNGFANSIAGNNGANVLDGLGGSDTLNGLGGADTFRFTTALGAGNVDTITGYVVADDVIEIDNAVFTGLAAGALAAGAFNTGAAATQADDRVIYNSATGALLFDADGAGGTAAVQFATLSAGLAMTAGEFLVI